MSTPTIEIVIEARRSGSCPVCLGEFEHRLSVGHIEWNGYAPSPTYWDEPVCSLTCFNKVFFAYSEDDGPVKADEATVIGDVPALHLNTAEVA